MRPNDRVELYITRGGFGEPAQRERALVEDDLRNDLRSPDAARKLYEF